MNSEFFKELPFGQLKTRHGVAIVLSYLDDSKNVNSLMQQISHRARAYIFNAKGLKGFLVPGVISIIEKANSEGKLEPLYQYQRIKI